LLIWLKSLTRKLWTKGDFSGSMGRAGLEHNMRRVTRVEARVARFLSVQRTKMEINYKIATKMPQNIPSGVKYSQWA
jgi:hypothetical protein